MLHFGSATATLVTAPPLSLLKKKNTRYSELKEGHSDLKYHFTVHEVKSMSKMIKPCLSMGMAFLWDEVEQQT